MRQQAGVPAAHWNALYERLLHNFAGFVQQLPASEAHHHRDAGGLLQHGLDTALKALTIRRGVLLPTGATSEHLADKQDVWTYATATAALLHDLGKPVVDQTVALFDADGHAAGSWNPLAGPMPATAAANAVSVVRGRRYRLHPRLPPLLVQFIVPPIGLEWIAKDLDVFEAWLATISGGDSEIAG
jgi:integrating conjugative element relaxase (TIGR03760 family)